MTPTQKEFQKTNCDTVSRILKRKANPYYDAAMMKIAEAKHMINHLPIPNGKVKVTVEIEPIELHLLDELMHDLKGECRNFTGKLIYKGHTIIIKSK